MASPRFLTALLACCAVGCGGSEVEAPTEATARAFALPHQWTSEDQLPVSAHGAPLLEGHLAFSLEIRKLPAGEIPEEIRSHYQTQFGGMRDAKRDVFDVVRGDTVLYSPLEVKRTSCVRRGRPDYWWRVQKCLEEELIPRTTYAWNEAKRRELPQTCVRVIAPADAPYPVLAKLIEVLGRESLLLTQV